jgi:hypothetical protein
MKLDPEIQKVLMNSKSVNKQKINYAKIDRLIRRTIRVLNQLPYLATFGCCAGHKGTQYFLGKETHDQPVFSDMYIAFEVYDEVGYQKLVKQMQKAFAGSNLTFYEDKLYPPPIVWQWVVRARGATRDEVKKGLAEARAKIIEIVALKRPMQVSPRPLDSK